MRCRECESLLWGYLDDELPELERRAVASHLAGCPRCALIRDQLGAFPLRATQLPTVAPPPDFTARLMQRIAPLPPPHELAAQRERTRIGGPLGLVFAFSVAAAAVIVGLLGTSAMVVFSGPAPAPSDTEGLPTANSISVWMAGGIWRHLTLPVILTVVGMLAVLALLWFRIAVPRRWSGTSYGLTNAPTRRGR